MIAKSTISANMAPSEDAVPDSRLSHLLSRRTVTFFYKGRSNAPCKLKWRGVHSRDQTNAGGVVEHALVTSWETMATA
ncbi:hypothetical protein DOTSEDRAFT_75681 [Dothistroma septosporum NZE10]|uniref:Uncharacterized protein n=1 Tax=Dothistroma septosporum (strain NZE10 / CBS 128990) TaxID=675120 RepID=M2WJB4_DOTSN|nr:hypothetical protein DOTSEDRAFT_75681 [Dothistroma septosporum NZE10]